MRGNLVELFSTRSTARSIPAYAGEPPFVLACVVDVEVYPRVCGGTRPFRQVAAAAEGLSPRMRGNRGKARLPPAAPGSIPAYAGEPAPRCTPRTGTTVYPRVCGGTRPVYIAGHKQQGLSPRMRGNPGTDSTLPNTAGSIPAYAGEPPVRRDFAVQREVYPRVCGGTAGGWEVRWDGGGLSPRMRGNRRRKIAQYIYERSIPAYAGEPGGPSGAGHAAGVYPRVCGGTGHSSSLPLAIRGLSPRMRGNPSIPNPKDQFFGSIPAYAGEPGQCAGWWSR